MIVHFCRNSPGRRSFSVVCTSRTRIMIVLQFGCAREASCPPAPQCGMIPRVVQLGSRSMMQRWGRVPGLDQFQQVGLSPVLKGNLGARLNGTLTGGNEAIEAHVGNGR